MLYNYIKIAFRSLRRYALFTLVNSIGLTAGIVFTLLIAVFVWSEYQVNRNLRNAERQYFLQSSWKGETDNYSLTTAAPLAKRLYEDYPALVAGYYRWDGITSVVSKGEKHLREGLQVGDSSLLQMYGFQLLEGNAATALNNPFSAVITEAIAIKYFGKKEVIGETIAIQSFSGENKDFLITGVLGSAGRNSVTEINDDNKNGIFIPLNTLNYFGRSSLDDWNNLWIPSYIELQENATVNQVEKAIQQIISNNGPPDVKERLTVKLVALTDYYLQQGDSVVARMLFTLSGIAFFILLMALVNFVNISISNAGARFREIGVRKTLGSLRRQLIFQFLAESYLLVLCSTVFAFALYPVLAPLFESITGKTMPALVELPLSFLGWAVLFVVVTGLLAGIYPAFVLSSAPAVIALKGRLQNIQQSILLRKSLLGFQFAVALIVLVSAAVITKQVSIFFSNQLGYSKEYVVSSQVPRDWSREGVSRMLSHRNEFATLSQVEGVSLSYEIPNSNNGGSAMLYSSGADSSNAINTDVLISDEQYLSVYQIPLKAGRFFSGTPADSGKLVINEKAVHSLGFKSSFDAIGKQVRIYNDPTVFTVLGVTNDFHFHSMQQNITPQLFMHVSYGVVHRFLNFKLKPGNVEESIAAIQKKWNTLLPGSSFEYRFMDDALKGLYANELRLKNAAYAAGILTCIIALLGLAGLVALSIHKRIKEVGIRKVLGASLTSILFLFIKDFILTLLVALLFAYPVAYLLVNGWLQDYAVKVNIISITFFLPAILLLLLTILLIVLQTIKAGIANPVKSLRVE